MQRSSSRSDPLLRRRIEHVRTNIRMAKVMEHFGHRYRTHGNMLCPFHAEQNPSARFYEDQDTFWCWTCAPQKGVDIIEYVLLELGFDADAPDSFPAEKKRAFGTIKALEYLELEFGVNYRLEPWEERLRSSLQRPHARLSSREDARRYYRGSHIQVLRILGYLADRDKWVVYSGGIKLLSGMASAPVVEQQPLWSNLRSELSRLK
jgi:hypothetical protein